MLLPLLLLALQQFPRSDATPADSAFARQVLAQAAREAPTERLQRQFLLWGFKPDATPTLHDPRLQANYLGDVWERDSAAAVDVLNRATGARHDSLQYFLSQRLAWARPATGERLARTLPPGELRVRALETIANAAMRDSARSRAIWREVVEEAKTLPAMQGLVMHYLYGYWKMGGAVTLQDFVDAAPGGENLRAKREQVVGLLASQHKPLVRGMLDSLIAEVPNDTAINVQLNKSWLLRVRGTPADSVEAERIQQKYARMHPPSDDYRVTRMLNDAILRQRDLAGLSKALLQMTPADAPRLAWVTANLSSGVPKGYVYPPPARDTAAFVFYAAVHDTLVRFTKAHSNNPVKDSILADLVGLRAGYNIPGALADAKSIVTTRFRQRAVARVARAAADVDVDYAESLAIPLTDAVAQTIAFGAITEKAISGGRLGAASRFVRRIADDETRLQRESHLAAAELPLRPDSARARLLRELPALDPRWKPEGVVIARIDGSEKPAGMSAMMIRDYMKTAMQAGLRHELLDWATKLPRGEKRAAGYAAILEALSELKLHEFPRIPIY